MGDVDSAPVPETDVGDSVEISVDLIAPETEGRHKSFWQMRSPDGGLFGSIVWVDILVVIVTATPTVTPTLTSTPTMTSTPTITPTPTLTPTVSACLDVGFVRDTIEDGTKLAPARQFTQTWTMRSTGCAPWPAGTTWVFVEGDQMGAPDSVPVPLVAVGETVEITVTMIAPDTPGTYRSFWQMQSPDGALFGSKVWTLITVEPATPVPGP